MTNHQHHLTVCDQRKCISSSLPLSSPSPQIIRDLLYSTRLSVYSSYRKWSGKTLTAETKKKPLFPLEHRNFFFCQVQKSQESDLVFCACAFTYYCGGNRHTAQKPWRWFYFTPILLNCNHHFFDYNHSLLTWCDSWEMYHATASHLAFIWQQMFLVI